MATSSFGQRFYVAKENIDEFIKVVTDPPREDDKPKFASHAMSDEELRKYMDKIFDRQ